MALPDSTLKQRNYIRRLLASRAGTEVADKNREMLNNSLRIRGYIPMPMAGQAIDALTSIPPTRIDRVPPVDPDEAEAREMRNYADIAREANMRFAADVLDEIDHRWTCDVTPMQVEIILEIAREYGVLS